MSFPPWRVLAWSTVASLHLLLSCAILKTEDPAWSMPTMPTGKGMTFCKLVWRQSSCHPTLWHLKLPLIPSSKRTSSSWTRRWLLAPMAFLPPLGGMSASSHWPTLTLFNGLGPWTMGAKGLMETFSLSVLTWSPCWKKAGHGESFLVRLRSCGHSFLHLQPWQWTATTPTRLQAMSWNAWCNLQIFTKQAWKWMRQSLLLNTALPPARITCKMSLTFVRCTVVGRTFLCCSAWTTSAAWQCFIMLGPNPFGSWRVCFWCPVLYTSIAAGRQELRAFPFDWRGDDEPLGLLQFQDPWPIHGPHKGCSCSLHAFK